MNTQCDVAAFQNPSFEPKEMTGPVQTAQVAPTILKALRLNPNALQAVRKTTLSVLPGWILASKTGARK